MVWEIIDTTWHNIFCPAYTRPYLFPSLPILPLQPLIHYSELAALPMDFSVAELWAVTLNALTQELQAEPHTPLGSLGAMGLLQPLCLGPPCPRNGIGGARHQKLSSLLGLHWVLDRAPPSAVRAGCLTDIIWEGFSSSCKCQGCNSWEQHLHIPECQAVNTAFLSNTHLQQKYSDRPQQIPTFCFPPFPTTSFFFSFFFPPSLSLFLLSRRL